MCSQPLFIVGSPRSGTTFFVNVLNHHPWIHITNETRIFSLLKDLIDILAWRPGLLGTGYQQHFANYARRQAGLWVEQFYRSELGISEPIWGDKYPGYAAIKVEQALRGRHRAVSEKDNDALSGVQPGSCLRLIRDSLPAAKFIHIHRDPRHVAWSLKQKGWVDSIEDGVSVWRQRVEEIDRFFGEIEPASCHTVAYTALLEHPEQATDDIARFLGLGESASMRDFLIQQRERPTPFSAPITDLVTRQPSTVPDDMRDRLLRLAGPRAEALSYF